MLKNVQKMLMLKCISFLIIKIMVKKWVKINKFKRWLNMSDYMDYRLSVSIDVIYQIDKLGYNILVL